MKRLPLFLIFIVGILFSVTPTTFFYQGKITDPDGSAINGTMPMTFKLYETFSGGTELWSETHTSVNIQKGLFTVILGDSEPLDVENFDAENLYLEIVVDGDVMTPRQKLHSEAYAFRAAVAESVSHVSGLNSPDGAISNAIYVDNDGEVGIGTTEPDADLHVNGDAVIEGSLTVNGPLDPPIFKLEPLPHSWWTDPPPAMYASKGWMYCSDADSDIKYWDGSDWEPISHWFYDVSSNEIGRIGKVGIGTITPNQLLTVDGDFGIIEGGTSPSFHTIFQGGDQTGDITYTLPIDDGTVDQVLTTDGSGVLRWANAAAGSSPDDDWAWSSGSGLTGDIYHTGNVGIGTSSPTAVLHVTGNTAHIGLNNTVTPPTFSPGANIAIGSSNDIDGCTGSILLGHSNETGAHYSAILGVRNYVPLLTPEISGVHIFGLDNTVTQSDAFAIGSHVLNNIANSIQLGWNSSDAPGALTILSSGNVGISTTTPNQLLTVDGDFGILEGGASPTFHSTFQGGDQASDITYTLPIDDGSIDQVLVTDGSGVLNWKSLTALTTSNFWRLDGNDITGTEYLGTNTSHSLKFYTNAQQRWSINTDGILIPSNSNASIRIGASAGSNATVSGEYNVMIGYNALEGSSLTGVGSNNVAIGRFALKDNYADINTAVGTNSLSRNTTGTGNSALGSMALMNNITGSQNTALGARAADNLTEGSGNIFIGADIDAPAATGNNQLVIGNIIYGTAIDGTGTTISTGNIGIGVTDPGQKLTVEGNFGIIEGGTSPTFHTIFQGGDQITDITYTLPINDGSASQVLTTNGTGILSWENPTGSGTVADNDWDIDIMDPGAGVLTDDVLITHSKYGIFNITSQGFGNQCSTHVNLGMRSQSGENGTHAKHVTISGGVLNTATKWWTTISGGSGNLADAVHSTIGGGFNNTIEEDGQYAVVSGGAWNEIHDYASVIAGGDSNTVIGLRSAVIGGAKDSIDGDYSAAFGYRARAYLDSMVIFDWYNSDRGAVFAEYRPNPLEDSLRINYSLIAGHSAKVYEDLSVLGHYYDSDNDPGSVGQVLTATAIGTEWADLTGTGYDNDWAWCPGGSNLNTDPIFHEGDVLIGNGIAGCPPEAELEVDGDLYMSGGDIITDRWLVGSVTGVSRNTLIGYQVAGADNMIHSTALQGYNNTAMGDSSIFELTTGYSNTAHGKSTLKNNTSGYGNTAVGTYAMFLNEIGNENCAFGFQALEANTEGDWNVAIGQKALQNHPNGVRNVALGPSALGLMTAGFQNTALGHNALSWLTEGEYNIAIGSNAGHSMTSGNHNIIIGRRIIPPNTFGDDQLVIGNIIYGVDIDGIESTISTGNIGIGARFPGQKLTVDGDFGILEGGTSPTFHTIFQGGDQTADITYTLPIDDGTVDQVLTTDGSGVLRWDDAAAGSSPDDDWLSCSGPMANNGNIYHEGQVLIGANDASCPPMATLDVQGNLYVDNIPMGSPDYVLVSDNGGGMIEQVSVTDLANVINDNDWDKVVKGNSPGVNNALETHDAFGIFRLNSSGFGTHCSTHVNLGVTCETGRSSINSKYSTVGGGRNNKSENYWSTVSGGLSNVATDTATTIGGGEGNEVDGMGATIAGGMFNTIDGISSSIGGGGSNTVSDMFSTIAGGQANAISSSYGAVVGGQSNVILGSSPHSVIGGGNANHIDASSQQSTIAGGELNYIYSPNCIIAGGSENMINTLSSFSYIGGGTGNSITSSTFSAIPGGQSNSITKENCFAFGQDADADMSFSAVFNWENGSANDGTVYIEIDAFDTDYELWVEGDAFATVAWDFSDLSLKENIIEINSGLAIIDQLRPITFDWNDKVKNVSNDGSAGFIAQELQNVLPELVSIANKHDGTLAVNYNGIIPYNTSAIQELNEKVETQQELINAQNEKLENQQKEIDYLKTQLEILLKQ